MVLTGEPIDARAALQAGLISEVCVDALTLERTQQMADRISRQAPLALRAAKQALKQAEEIGLSQAGDGASAVRHPGRHRRSPRRHRRLFENVRQTIRGADLWITH